MQTFIKRHYHLKHPIKAGSRIVKTAVAVTLAYLITDLLATPTPIHAVVAVIITMQPTMYETVTTSKVRLWGTVIGLIIGTIYLFFIPTNAFTMGFGIFITLTLCTNFGWYSACGISCFALISLITKADASILDGLYRLLDTGIGVFASLLVNFLAPNKSVSKTLDQQLTDMKSNLLSYLIANLESYITQEQKENLYHLHRSLQNSFKNAKEKYQKYEDECNYRHYSYSELNLFNELYNNLWSIFILVDQIHIDVADGQRVHTNLHSIFTECLTQLKGLSSLLAKNDEKSKQDIQDQLNYLTNILQTDLLAIEKIGIDEYDLSRNEKREVANKLYLLLRIIELLKMITK